VKKLGKRLTFANVVACLALFVALGGTGYAALKLPKNSVGAKQLRKGAVTPAKLNLATRKTLTGVPGPVGPTGPRGAAGADGQRGPQGPGLTSFNVALPADGSEIEIATVSGVVVTAGCDASFSKSKLQPIAPGATLDLYGYFSFNGTLINPLDRTAGSANAFSSGTGNHEVDVDAIIRNTAVTQSFTRLTLHVGGPSNCVASGTVIPATA
jgi:hypothetical protein